MRNICKLWQNTFNFLTLEKNYILNRHCAMTLFCIHFHCTFFFSLAPVVAFSVAYNQNKQLIGENGLMPSKNYLNSVKRYVGGKIGMAAFAYTPSILWLLDWSDMDANLDYIALVGMALSMFVLLTGMANMVIMVMLWVLYHSLVNVGQLWWVYRCIQSRTWQTSLRFLS